MVIITLRDKSQAMKGIQYVLNDKNERVAVQIDLKKYGDLWEDIYDSIVADARKNEERVSFKDLKENLKSKSKAS
jgi:hypothetical protein